MQGCKVKFFKDPVRQRVIFSAKWTTPDQTCIVDNGGFAINATALSDLETAMNNYSAQYIDNYDGCADGFAIAAVDEANDKLMYAVNAAAAKAAKTIK